MDDYESFFKQNFKFIEKKFVVSKKIHNKKIWIFNNERVKVIKLCQRNVREILEKRILLLINMTKIDIINIQKILGYSVNDKGFIYIIFEYIDGKLLRDEIIYMNDKIKIEILFKIAEIIRYVHSRKLFFIELKLSNIYIYPNDLIKFKYISHFKRDYINSEFTKKYNNEDDKIFYESPDLYDYPLLEDTILLNQRRTIWAYGCLISEIISLILPWHKFYSNKLHIEALLIEKSDFPIPSIFAEKKYEKLKTLIKMCTETDGEKRILIDEAFEKILEIVKTIK